MPVLVYANFKGGVGKTTNSVMTAYQLALFIILIFFALFAIYLMQNIIINLSTVNNKKNNRLHF